MAGYDGILQTKTLLPSLKASNVRDVRFGEGQYLYDILPHTRRPGQLSLIFLNLPWAGAAIYPFI
jgi:hypothetical protein